MLNKYHIGHFTVYEAAEAVADPYINMAIVEEIDWLDVLFHGLIIGSNGSGLKRIKKETGATVEIKNQQCIVKGTRDEVEKAKEFIMNKVYEKPICTNMEGYEKPICTNKEGVSKLEVFDVQEESEILTLKGVEDVEDEFCESVDFLDPKYFGAVIGKRDSHLKELDSRFELKLKRDTIKNKIVMKGSEAAKIKAEEWIREFVSENEQSSAESANQLIVRKRNTSLNWENVDFIGSEFFGEIIGKGGSNIKQLERKYGLSIRIDKENNKVVIKGADEAKKKITEEYFRKLVMTSKIKSTKHVFWAGLKDKDQILLTLAGNCKDHEHCEITEFKNSFNISKSYSSIPGLEKALQNAFQVTKSYIEDNPEVTCDILVHAGMMHYKYKPGRYEASNGRYEASKVIQKYSVYERLTKDQVSFDKLQSLPVIKNTIRYDFAIGIPKSLTELEYRIYLQFNEEEEQFKFVSCEDAGVDRQMFSTVQSGPGYFCSKKKFDYKI